MTRRLAASQKTSVPPVAQWLRQPAFWGVTLGVVLAAVLLLTNAQAIFASLERMSYAREWIAGFGPLAPLAYIMLNIAQVVVAPFPGSFMGVAAGYLFGIIWGTFYSIIGLALGATIAIVLGRVLGRPVLVRLFSEAQLNELEGRLRMRSPALWFVVFMFPVPDLLIYMAGMSSVPLRLLLPAIVAGRSVGILLANIIGGWSAHLSPEWLLVKWSVILVLAGFVYVYQRRLRLYALLGYRRARRYWRRYTAATPGTSARIALATEPCSSRESNCD